MSSLFSFLVHCYHTVSPATSTSPCKKYMSTSRKFCDLCILSCQWLLNRKIWLQFQNASYPALHGLSQSDQSGQWVTFSLGHQIKLKQ